MAIAFVNETHGQNTSGAATTVATAAASATGGNLMVVGVRQDTDGTAPSSVTDTAGNSYTHLSAADSQETVNDLLSIWYAKSITGNGSNIVTANWAVGHNFTSVMARQYSGCDTSAPADATGTGAINGAGAGSITSSSFTTTSANEVIVVFTSGNSTAQGYTVGTIGGVTATNLAGDNSAGSMMSAGEDLIVSSIQTGITASFNNSSSLTQREISVATFKAAAGGATSGLKFNSSLSGLGSSGPFFHDRLA